jgi:hypothetical protein
MGLLKFLNLLKKSPDENVLRLFDQLTVFPKGAHDFGPCDCCGDYSRSVNGFVNQGDKTIAAYVVHWTLSHLEHGAHFDLILGKWGEKTETADRCAVSLEYRALETGPAFMVIDATERPVADHELVSRALKRNDVIGHSIAEKVFAVADAVLFKDERLKELLA